MRRLLNLLASNAKRGDFRAEGNTIFIYDAIVSSDMEAEWFGGVSAQAFAKTLAGMTGDVSLRINSPGGDVFAARAMAQAMREYPGAITCHVDGYAASAASVIAIAGAKCIMAPGSFMMIHKAWSCVMGNADEMLSMASLLEKIDGTLAQSYADRTGGKASDFADFMAKETWFTPEEAVSAKLADEIAPTASPDAKASIKWDLSAYDAAPTPQADTTTVTVTIVIEDDDDAAEEADGGDELSTMPETDTVSAESERRARILAARLLTI